MILHINCTETALQHIAERQGQSQANVKLVYNIEGCGCALSGVAELWIVEHLSEDDALATGHYPIYYDTRHTVFFEDELVIDYSPSRRTFTLKSNGQFYNASMLLYDKREQLV